MCVVAPDRRRSPRFLAPVLIALLIEACAASGDPRAPASQRADPNGGDSGATHPTQNGAAGLGDGPIASNGAWGSSAAIAVARPSALAGAGGKDGGSDTGQSGGTAGMDAG